MKIKTKDINISSMSLISLNLKGSTFQKARLRIVKKYGFTIAKYLICKIFDDNMNYKNHYIRLK